MSDTVENVAAGGQAEVTSAAPVVDEAADAGTGSTDTTPAEVEADAPAPAPASAQPRAPGRYDPSVPADEVQMHSTGGYDPSMPADEMEAGQGAAAGAGAAAGPTAVEGYDPSMPASDMNTGATSSLAYDPSMPAGDVPHGGGGYDPSMPAGAGEDEGGAAEPLVVDQEDVPIAPPPANAYDDPTAEAEPAVPTYDDAPLETLAESTELKIGLPEGLTDESLSVVANPQLVRQYRLDPDPQVDPTAALGLFNWSVQKTEVVDARAWYEVIALRNPTAAQPLLTLINLELALSNFPEVEQLFARGLGSSTTLMAAPDINLWKAYLHYIRRQNPSDGPDGEKARTTVTQAYEYALKECGVDRESGELWQEYIQYVAEPKPKSPWDIQMQVDTLRNLYQRAVAVPLNNVEALWKAYDVFETQQNKVTAKKFLADKSPAYMTARTALREMRGLTDILPQHIIPRKPQFTELDRHVVTGWRAYIKWEESNPLNTENEALVNQRVGYALKKCMAQMRHFPELWYYSASYHLTNGLVSEGIEFLKCGVAACPKSFLLTFALAEMEEEGNNGDAVPDIFQALLKQLDDEIDEFSGKVAAEVEVARGPEIPLVSTIEKGEDSDHARLVRERDERGKLVQERWAKRIGEVKTAAGIVWVTYMRFTRRHGGLSAARKIFTKARKSPHQTWHVFEASALMEHRYGTSAKTGDNKEGAAVAVRVFELGLKQFSEDVDFVMSYLNYLLSVNDDTNARALFERSVLKIPADKARPLWDTWAQFEYTYGDLTAVRKLEARFAEAFPKETPLKRFAARYTFHGIDEIALRDLGLARGRAAAPPPPLAASAANVFPPFPPGQIRPASPSQKRALSPPRSPARVDTFKRARAQSPPRGNFVPPAQNRFAPHQQQQQQGQGQRDTSPFPRAPVPGARPAAAATNGPPQALSWFVTRLPTAQSFDGPVFHADDIVGLFAGINANGTAASAAHAHAPAPAPSRPPMGRQGFRGPGRRF